MAKSKRKPLLTKAQKAKLKKKASAGLKIAQAKLKIGEKKVRAFVNKHPEKAAVIAAALGAAVGAAVGKALKKK